MDLGGPPPLRVECSASYGRMLGIVLGNLVLTVLTLGLYAPWGRVRVRDYLWSSTSIAGEPLDYTGTGGELLRGALLALVLVIGPVIVAEILVDDVLLGETGRGVGRTVGGLVLGYLAGVGIYRAQRYRLRRTLWSGLGGTMRDRGWGYGAVLYLGALHVALSLGLTRPLYDRSLARAWYPTMQLAGARVWLDDHFRPPWRRWLVCWLLAIPTLGISLAWYGSAFWRRLAGHVEWAGLRFRCTATGGRYLWLTVGNLLILVLSLGLLAPLAALRSWRFWCRHLEPYGALDTAMLEGVEGAGERSGEGLASMLDAGGL